MQMNENYQPRKPFTPQQAKTIVEQLFIQAERLDDTALGQITRSLLSVDEIRPQTVHIVFDRAFAGALRHAFRKEPLKSTEQIISLPDILSIGPVESLHTDEGIKNRFCWLQEHLRGDIQEQENEFRCAVQDIKRIPPHLPIILWAGNNAAEQTGLRFATYLLSGRPNEISELNTTKAFESLYRTTKHSEEIHILRSSELSPEQLLELYAHYEPWKWNPARRIAIEQEGKSLMYDGSYLRTWQYDELWSSDEDRHDSFIMECARQLQSEYPGEYYNVLRLIGQVYGELEQYTGDTWIEYRVKELIRHGELASKGDLGDWRKYEIGVIEDHRTIPNIDRDGF
ncbi:hypothetical protein CSV71_05735 [Sporosarcina sp. P21c]|nr:hypothetical protein CSV78_07955 [Sporosarcina sp. P16a]PIC90201.1 hypothetical protein CSV71_05735 [Sporosarcina sp. P21c]PIC92710.1 hypothetical protein CSV70_08705 [Sporosarcina sp. P25]